VEKVVNFTALPPRHLRLVGRGSDVLAKLWSWLFSGSQGNSGLLSLSYANKVGIYGEPIRSWNLIEVEADYSSSNSEPHSHSLILLLHFLYIYITILGVQVGKLSSVFEDSTQLHIN